MADIARLARHAHRFNARIFVTLNTILRDDELEIQVETEASYEMVLRLAREDVQEVADAALQLLDVRVPTTDGRELLLVRRTEPDRDVALLLARLNLTLPPQPPPRICGCAAQGKGQSM